MLFHLSLAELLTFCETYSFNCIVGSVRLNSVCLLTEVFDVAFFLENTADMIAAEIFWLFLQRFDVMLVEIFDFALPATICP